MGHVKNHLSGSTKSNILAVKGENPRKIQKFEAWYPKIRTFDIYGQDLKRSHIKVQNCRVKIVSVKAKNPENPKIQNRISKKRILKIQG